MEKNYAPKTPRSAFDIDIEGKDKHYIRSKKAKLLAEADIERTLEYKGYVVTLLDKPHTTSSIAQQKDSNHTSDKNEWLEVSLSIKNPQTGENIFVDNPCQWQNPPYKVEDGTFYKEVDPILGEIDIPNLVDDPKEAFKRCIFNLADIFIKRSKGEL